MQAAVRKLRAQERQNVGKQKGSKRRRKAHLSGNNKDEGNLLKSKEGD